MAETSELALAFREGIDPQLPLASLRLLVSPLRLMSASMWRMAQQRNVQQYGRLADFITLVTEMVPELLTPKQTAELVLGLRARHILELLQKEDQLESDTKAIQEHLDGIQLLTKNYTEEELQDEEVEVSKTAFVELVQMLTNYPSKKYIYFKTVFHEHYGPRFDTTLQILVWEFLSRLEELLPVASFFKLASNFHIDSLDPKLEDFVSEPEDLKTLLHHHTKGSQKLEKNHFSFRSKVILSSLASKETSLTTDVFGEEAAHGNARQLSMSQIRDQLSELGSSLCLEEALSGRCDTSLRQKDGADAAQREEEVIGSSKGNAKSGTDTAATGSHSCPQCGETFASWPELLDHQAVHVGELARIQASKLAAKRRAAFKCDQCPRQLRSAGALKKHVAAHARDKTAVCPQCNKVFKHRSWLREHLRLHTGERPFLCTFCGKRFKEKVVLREHLVLHGNVRPYMCNKCGKGYNHRSSLVQHARIHTGEKPYQCDVCGKHSRTLSMFREHQRVHTGERPHPCGECGKRFTSAYQLKRHGRTHSGEKPHQCPVCDKRFAERSNMRIHMKVHR
ncbi:Zinc finger protein 782 [Merluccius polli]|uniref:Zinc finger protein 782 n=1 Tax=Merluccius polli TaxID=89951 RepID=A0AA47P1D9_MERPO|nr:Zinc finger protein 782 [Merluccius polli]